MEIEKYTPNDLKKLFTKGCCINFLNDYTFQDVEDGKKKLYLQMNETQDKTKLKDFLDDAGKKLIPVPFVNNFFKSFGVYFSISIIYITIKLILIYSSIVI